MSLQWIVLTCIQYTGNYLPGMLGDYIGSRVMPEWEGMKLLTGLQEQFWSVVYWAWALLWGLQAEYKKEDETLDEESASGIVARSL